MHRRLKKPAARLHANPGEAALHCGLQQAAGRQLYLDVCNAGRHGKSMLYINKHESADEQHTVHTLFKG